MKRLSIILGFLCFAAVFQLNASDADELHLPNGAELAQYDPAEFASPLLAMNMKEWICVESGLEKVEATSQTFECCNQDARAKAAISTVKELHYKISEICKEKGCDLSAIARICVSYEQVSEGKCVAVVTAWYSCCCCVVESLPFEADCKPDKTFCEDHGVDSKYDAAKYKCCDVDDRWNTTYKLMKSLYDDVAYQCSILRCVGGLMLRGFQIDYTPYSEDGTCLAETTILYSCCCVCE